MADTFDYVICGGGLCGPVVAGRLSEDPNCTILLLEAGKDSAEMDDMHMSGAWTQNHKGETDWNIYTPPQPGLNNREIHVPRGRFLGGSAGFDKVILKKDRIGTIEAKGVEYEDDNGNKFKAFARREVILAGGTYGSPAMLLRSGIGPKADLEVLNIPGQVDLPGVGKNLQDHQLIFIYYELNQPGLTDDPRVNHDPNAYENGAKEWRENKSGWLAQFPFGAFAFNRLDDRLTADNPEWRQYPRKPGRNPMDLTPAQPNLEFFHTVCYGGPPEYTDKPKEGQFAFAMCCFLCGAQSRGEVTLKSTNCHENPLVDHKYMSDKRDLLMMSEGVRFANEVVTTGAGTKDKIKGAWPPGATHHLNKTNEDWQPFVQRYASTSYHPGGTCKLGSLHDKMAVVDTKLRVYGVKGLRVADCSIMPTIHSGHTQMPAFGIAEKAAEYIIEEASSYGNAESVGYSRNAKSEYAPISARL